MARKGRRGALSRETYFPGTGDQLEDPFEGVVWICAKANTYTDPHTGQKFRYALLVGRSSAFDESIPRTIHSEEDPSGWLEGVTTIRRRLSHITVGDTYRIYDFSEATGTWQQRIEE